MANNFVSNPGASPWQVTSPSRRAVRHQVESQSRQRLQEEAASLLPDTNYLSEVLMKHDLSAADKAVSINTLNTKLDSYLGKYKENPYYAFSREGTEGIKELKRMVNSPGLLAASQAFQEDKETKKRYDSAGVNGYLNVNGDKVQVIDTQDEGRLTWVDPSRVDYERYVPGTLDEIYAYRTGNKGYYDSNPNNIQANTFNMEDPEKIRGMIQGYFADIGSDKRQSIGQELLSTVTDSNAGQIKYRLNALMSEMGLTQAAKNTLYSQFYKTQRDAGQPLSKEKADQEFRRYIGDIAGGKLATDVTYKENPVLNAGLQNAALTGSAGTSTSEHAFLNGERVPYQIDGNNGKKKVTTVTQLDKATLNRSASFYTDKDKNKHPRLNLAEANTTRLTHPGSYTIADLNNPGRAVPIPEELVSYLQGGIVLDNGVFNSTMVSRNDNGTKSFIGAEDNINSNNVEGQVMYKGYFQSGQGSKEAKAFQAFLEGLGYGSQDDSEAGMSIDTYRKNISDTYELDLGFLPDWSQWGYNDNLFSFQLLAPTDDNTLRAIEGKDPSQRAKNEYNFNGVSENQVSTNGLIENNPYNINGKADGFKTINDWQ